MAAVKVLQDRLPAPDDLKIVNVVSGDLTEGRVVCEGTVAAEVGPFATRRLLGVDRHHRDTDETESGEKRDSLGWCHDSLQPHGATILPVKYVVRGATVHRDRGARLSGDCLHLNRR